jgi:hypothetical protein
MSAIGPKRTSLVALQMSASGGKADTELATAPVANPDIVRRKDRSYCA